MDLTEHWRTVQAPCEDDDDDGVGGHEDVEKRREKSDGCKLEGWEDGEWSYRMNSSGVSSSLHVFSFCVGLGSGFVLASSVLIILRFANHGFPCGVAYRS